MLVTYFREKHFSFIKILKILVIASLVT